MHLSLVLFRRGGDSKTGPRDTTYLLRAVRLVEKSGEKRFRSGYRKAGIFLKSSPLKYFPSFEQTGRAGIVRFAIEKDSSYLVCGKVWQGGYRLSSNSYFKIFLCLNSGLTGWEKLVSV